VNDSTYGSIASCEVIDPWDCRYPFRQPDWAVTLAAGMPERQAIDTRFTLTGADPATVERAFDVAYEQLRRMAHRYLKGEPSGHTLTTTDLVHQAYLELADDTRALWTSESHFMGIAAVAMRRILVDHARRHQSLKRGGGLRRVPLDSANPLAEDRAEVLLALDEVLERLRRLDARQAQVVECRFFAGMTEDETAKALDVAPRTVKRDWAKARSWLYREIFIDV
jgi:RNA polymerase sigma factor (TIGR02999 family)